ncbi:replicative DNA helicase [Arhodomonas sp. SL1]|uniref:replicative DNA helicase n=1 Tax=Arhodomonas sp. SL1 TaxID=3425691 RepID=UPI003F8819AD
MRQDEQAILAALLFDPSAILELDLSAEEFSTGEGHRAFSAMQALAARGAAVDGPTLGNELGDYALVARIAEAQGSPRNVEHYAASIRQAARLRAVQRLCRDTATAAQAHGADPDALSDRLLSALSASRGDAGDWSMADVMADTLGAVSEAREARRQGGTVGVSTGFRDIDRALGGLRGGRLYVVGGRPKMGKTGWALSLQTNAARSGHRVGFASSEMAAPECGARWLAAAAGVDASRMQTGELTDSEEQRLAAASSRLAELPIHILDKAGVTPGRIRRQAMSWQRRHGLDLLVVDYLQRLQPDSAGERRDLTVGAMARAFKTLARDLDIPVVLLVQLSRAVEQREDKRPQPADLRDSGEIEQEADVIAFLYRHWVYLPDADPCEAEFLIRANRHGPPGVARLHFDARHQRWLDRDLKHYEEVA